MILFKSSVGVGCIELHTDGDTYWFMEWWQAGGDQVSKSDPVWRDPCEIVSMVAQKRWHRWPERPWLAPMVEFMRDHFGEGLFTLVALENL